MSVFVIHEKNRIRYCYLCLGRCSASQEDRSLNRRHWYRTKRKKNFKCAEISVKSNWKCSIECEVFFYFMYTWKTRNTHFFEIFSPFSLRFQTFSNGCTKTFSVFLLSCHKESKFQCTMPADKPNVTDD